MKPATGNKGLDVPCVACKDGTIVVIHPTKFTAERIQCPDCKGTMMKHVLRKGATHG